MGCSLFVRSEMMGDKEYESEDESQERKRTNL